MRLLALYALLAALFVGLGIWAAQSSLADTRADSPHAAAGAAREFHPSERIRAGQAVAFPADI